MITFTAAQLALLIQGRVEGDAGASVTSFGKIEEAQAGQLAFLSNPKYEDFLYTTGASVVIVNESLELKKEVPSTLIRVKDAYSAFATLLAKYQEIQTQQLSGIQQPSYIDPSAQLGQQVFVGAFVYIGKNVKVGNHVKLFPGVFLGDNVQVDDNTQLHSGVKIYNDCKIGASVIIHAGTVIGSDGFGFAPRQDGTYQKIPQIGNVIVEDHVEIGANTCIDRATIGSTIIRTGVKLDNLIQIAHNVEIGAHSAIAAQAGISGSTKIGKYSLMGGQVGVAGHLQLADGLKVGAQSGIGKSVKQPNTSLFGSPAFDYHQQLRSYTVFKRLPELEKKIAELESRIRQLTEEKSIPGI